MLAPEVLESEPQLDGLTDQFKLAAPAGSLVLALIASADAPDKTVWFPFGEVMLTVIGLTVTFSVVDLLASVAEVTVTVAVQAAVSGAGAL